VPPARSVEIGADRIVTPDWDCLFRARKGDEAAWRELAECFQPRLTALALVITRSATAAEDIVQETFLRAHRSRLSNTDGSLGGYLGTIAYRLAVKESQHARRQTETFTRDAADDTSNPLERLLTSERDRLVAAAVASLDDCHRDVLLLRFYGDHSYDQIARLLQIPVGTVKSRMFHAVRSCRELLCQQGVLNATYR